MAEMENFEPKTWFAPPEKASADMLNWSVNAIARNPLVDGLMKTVGGLLAVLNEQRQIIAVNETMIKQFGITDMSELLGLRLGELVGCTHAEEPPAGCGTTEYCASCGAAIAMAAALIKNESQEHKCAIKAIRDGKQDDLFLSVRACPITCDEKLFVLIFIHDISAQVQRSSLERFFFHDISNIVGSLNCLTESMDNDMDPEEQSEFIDLIKKLSKRLSREVSIQKALSFMESEDYRPAQDTFFTSDIITDAQAVGEKHPSASGKTLEIDDNIPKIEIKSDLALVERIITNMLINAFEATDEGGSIKLSVESTESGECTFKVWNAECINPALSKRIFQRNFSTKNEEGRGLGTFSMRLFGEKYLHGKVGFTSTPEDGTTFYFSTASQK